VRGGHWQAGTGLEKHNFIPFREDQKELDTDYA